MEFTGKEIKALRKLLNMSQVEFGQMVGVSKLTVINWELGKTEIRKESVKQKIQELMQEYNVANNNESLGEVEVIGSDVNDKIITIKLPCEAFEPTVFLSVIDKFLNNPDITKREKSLAIRSIRRKLIDCEDNMENFNNNIHIWPDKYILERNKILLPEGSSEPTPFLNRILSGIGINIQNEINKKLETGTLNVEDIFNLTVLPSYINSKELIDKTNYYIRSKKDINTLFKLALFILKEVMNNNKSYKSIYSLRPTELDEFFDNFGDQLSGLGFLYNEIQKLFISCEYINLLETNKCIQEGELDNAYIILLNQLVEQGYLTEDEVFNIEVSVKEKRFNNFEDLLHTIDTISIHSYLKNKIGAYQLTSIWCNDDFSLNELLYTLTVNNISKTNLYEIKLSYIISELEKNNTIPRDTVFDVIAPVLNDINKNANLSEDEKFEELKTRLLNMGYRLCSPHTVIKKERFPVIIKGKLTKDV